MNFEYLDRRVERQTSLFGESDIPEPWASLGEVVGDMTRLNPSGNYELVTCHRCPNDGHCGDCWHLSEAVQRLGRLEHVEGVG